MLDLHFHHFSCCKCNSLLYMTHSDPFMACVVISPRVIEPRPNALDGIQMGKVMGVGGAINRTERLLE